MRISARLLKKWEDEQPATQRQIDFIELEICEVLGIHADVEFMTKKEAHMFIDTHMKDYLDMVNLYNQLNSGYNGEYDCLLY